MPRELEAVPEESEVCDLHFTDQDPLEQLELDQKRDEKESNMVINAINEMRR